MSLPVESDWTFTRGDTVTRRVVYGPAEPVTDVAGWLVRAQARPRVDGEVWLTKTHEAGITVVEVDGKLDMTITLDPGDTEGWPRSKWNGVWDLEVVSPTGVVRTIVRGAFVVEGDVTVIPGE